MCEVVKLVWQIGRKVNEGRVRLCARAAALAYNRPASSSSQGRGCLSASRPPESRSDVMPFALLLALAATPLLLFLREGVRARGTLDAREGLNVARRALSFRRGREPGALLFYVAAAKSEERRVGKECRSRWSPY